MDPVNEYNKGLESFEMHFNPKAEELFTIILQICRFLKEFSDFETKSTPEFRHPNVKAKVIQSRINNKNARQDSSVDSDKHGINQIFTKKKKNDNKNNGKGETSDTIKVFKQDDEVEVSDKEEDDEATEKVKRDENKINFLNDIGILAELNKMFMTEDTGGKVIDGHERYNVDVLSGRDKFMAYFRKIITDKKIKKNHNVDKIFEIHSLK